MANANRPTGLSPIKHLNGDTWNGIVNTYVILAANTAVYGIGSAVKSFAGGDANGVPAVTLAAAGDALRGMIVGVIPLSADSPVGPIPATKLRNYYVLVCDDSTVICEIQANNTGDFPTSDLNSNANLVVGAPLGTSPFASTQLDAATTDVTSTLQLKILRKSQEIGVDLTANTKLWVMINNHELRGGTAAVV
jgi:hypothetical protein